MLPRAEAIITAGFGFRISGLGAEGLSEDELNKINAVADYRAHGLTAANGEHPMLMKSLQTASIFLAAKWNESVLVSAHKSDFYIQSETALRLPGVIFGVLTAILIYLVTAELFGAEVALIAAALWAFDPNAILYNHGHCLPDPQSDDSTFRNLAPDGPLRQRETDRTWP